MQVCVCALIDDDVTDFTAVCQLGLNGYILHLMIFLAFTAAMSAVVPMRAMQGPAQGRCRLICASAAAAGVLVLVVSHFGRFPQCGA